MEPDPPMTASPKLPGPNADVYRQLEPSERTDVSMQEIERLLKVNHDLQRQVANKVPEAPWSLSPERPREVPGSRCQAALAALEPVALPERCGCTGQSLLASRGSSLPDMNRWEAVGSLTAEKEALTGQLKSEELLQLESVRLATEAEARLARVNAELDALRKPPRGSEKLASSEELEAKLRQQLQAVRADCDARQRRIQDYDGSLQRSNSALASLRADKELAISDHGELREKALAAREQLESRIQCLRSARAAVLAAESRRHGSPVTSPRRERLSCARTAVAHLEEEQRQKEHEVLSTRQVLRDLQQVAAEQQSALQRIKAGNEEMVAKSARGASQRTQAAQHAASMVEERSREKHSLSAALQVTEKELVETEAAVTMQRQRESEAFAAEQRRSVEELQEAEASLWALRSRLEDTSSELQAEQEQNLRLRQEVLALQAAKEHILKRLETPRTYSFEGNGAGFNVRAKDSSPGPSMPAWAKTHQQRLEQELDQLRKWKFEAAGAVQRMALGLRNLRDQYDQEMRKSFDLQETWQRLGHRAENAGLATSFPSVQEADDLLQSEGVQPTRPPFPVPRRAARRSPKAKEASRTAVNLSAGWWNGHGATRSTRSTRSRGRRDVQAPRAKSNSTGRLNKSSPSPGGHRVRAKLLS